MEEETDGRDSSHRQQQQKLQQHQRQRQQLRQAAAPPTRSRFLGCFALSRTKSSKAAALVPVPRGEEEDGLPEQQHGKRKRSQQHQQEQEEMEEETAATATQRKRQKFVVRSESIVSISSSESSSFDPTALLAEHEEPPPQQLRIPGTEDDWLFTSSSKHATSASHSPTRTATDSGATRPTSRRRTAPPAATPELEEAPLSEAEKRERQRRMELAHSQAATTAACPSSSVSPARRVPTVATITSPPPRDREHKHEQHQEASDVQQKLARHSSGSSSSSRSWKITDATTTALPPFCPPSLAGHRVAPPGVVDQEGRSATTDTQQQQQQVPDSAESTKTAFFSSHAPSSQGSLVSSRSWFQLAAPLDSALARPAAAASATGEHGECRGLGARHIDDTTPAAQALAVDRVEDSQTTGAFPAAERTMPGVSIKVEDVPTAQTSVSLGNAISDQDQPPVSQQQPSEPASPWAAPPAPVSGRGSSAESPDLRSTSPEVVVPNLSARKPGRPPRLSAAFDTDEETASDKALRPDFGKKRQQLRKPKTATAGKRTYNCGSASETETDRRKQGRRKPRQQQQLFVESDTQTDVSRASSGLGRIALALAKPFSRNPNPTREEKIDLAAPTGLTTKQVGEYYSKERRRAGVATLLRPGQYRTSASLEPLGTTSAVSDRTSSSTSSSSSESETEHVDIVEEADTSDDARYQDASSRRVKAELERAKKEMQPFFPSSSLTSIAESNVSTHTVTLAAGTRPAKSARKERLVRGRLTAAQKGKGRAIETAQAPESSTEHDFSFDDTDIEPNNVASRAAPRQGRPSRRGQPVRLGRAQPGRPPRRRHGPGGQLSYQVPVGPPTSSGVTRRPKVASGSVPPLAFGEVEANPVRYTRSRTSVANPNTAQCHRCEAFYSKSGCFKCITCDGAVCQRCLIEHYSDQGVYIAIVAFLVGKMREELRLAKSQQHKGTSDLTDGIVMETGTSAAEGEVGFSSSAMSRVFNLPPTVDLSTLDFQCPVCKMLCMCANCLRGPYPVGHPLHKSSLLAAAAEAENPPQPEYADGDGDDEDCDIDEDAIQVVTGRRRPIPRSDSEDNLDVEVEHYSPPRVSSGPHAARRRSSNRTAPSSFSVLRSHEALQQARADRARMDDDQTEVVPFVVTRPKSTAVSNPRANAVPRLGSPPLARSGSGGMHGVEQSNSAACTEAPMPVRRSARVRLATKVGEQLGAGKGAKSTASGPVEPVFTFPEDVWSTAATPGTEYEGQLFEDADGAETEQLTIGPIEERRADLADPGRMTLEEEDEMVRQFASIPDAPATVPYDGSDVIIPDFAYALSGSLGEQDNTTKTASTLDMASGSTISTASTDSSLASPSAFPDGHFGPLHSFDLESTKPPAFLDFDAFVPDHIGNRPGDDWMDYTSGLNFSPSKCGGIGFDSAEWQHTLQFYDDVF